MSENETPETNVAPPQPPASSDNNSVVAEVATPESAADNSEAPIATAQDQIETQKSILRALKKRRPKKEVADPLTDPRLDYLGIPEWLRKLSRRELITLPMSEIDYGPEIYSKAIVVLYRKGISFTKLKLISTFFMTPALWPTKRGKPFNMPLSYVFWRFILMLLVFLSIVGATGFFTSLMGYPKQAYKLAFFTAVSLFTIHIIVSLDYARPWRKAFRSYHKGVLDSFLPTEGELEFYKAKDPKEAKQ